LYPTLEHQSREYLQQDYLQEIELLLKNNGPNFVQDKINTITILARIEGMQEFNDETKLSKLEKYHIWNEKYVNMRMSYNPKKPMNALLLRIYKLPEPISVKVNPEWAGCKSWINIDLSNMNRISSDNIDKLLNLCEPVIKEDDFQKINVSFTEIWD